MRRHLGAFAAAAFVPLWSTGILFGAVAIRHGPPFAVTTLRFAAATLLLAGLAAWRRAAEPARFSRDRFLCGFPFDRGL